MKPIEGKSDCVVIIPTYNERENAAAIIEAVMNQPHEMDVLVVDDGSPDGTAAIVRGKMEEYRTSASRLNEAESSTRHRLHHRVQVGPSSASMNTYSRWMPTFPTTPTTSWLYTRHVPKVVPMWPSVPVT